MIVENPPSLRNERSFHINVETGALQFVVCGPEGNKSTLQCVMAGPEEKKFVLIAGDGSIGRNLSRRTDTILCQIEEPSPAVPDPIPPAEEKKKKPARQRKRKIKIRG